MTKNKRQPPIMPGDKPFAGQPMPRVASLLDMMEDGREYQSILPAMPHDDVDVLDDVVKCLKGIEAVRSRKCLLYVGGMVRPTPDAAVDASDDLPFLEMVGKVPASEKKIDVLLSTPGGSAQQIGRFVNSLRSRFDEVDILIPSMCMSAGTLFALSADRIWMTPRACLGPIDPQVPTKDGRYVPAQALLLLVAELQRQGQEALAKREPVPWSAVRIIDTIDKKELADAQTATHYSIMMATDFLERYKFRSWNTRKSSGIPPTDAYKRERAEQIAQALASHDKWKSHGHAISRDTLWDEIQLEVDHPAVDLEKAMTRLWAVISWIFDKTPIVKMIISTDYRYAKYSIKQA